ncbi:hypothetical protein MKEN_00554700 [Mycena kentingensis (nom. inval.)]|nr:hypothetical protein MKEN_00554700 [Mycena kentingensis (nom. inval.)]
MLYTHLTLALFALIGGAVANPVANGHNEALQARRVEDKGNNQAVEIEIGGQTLQLDINVKMCRGINQECYWNTDCCGRMRCVGHLGGYWCE